MIVNAINELSLLRPGKPLLVMLPFAGGNAYSYNSIARYIPQDFDVVCPELPGRGVYSGQPFMTRIDDLCRYVFSAWLRAIDLDRPYVIFGHSMGALLAHHLVHYIDRAQLNLPLHVFVSGRSGPSFKHDREESVHRLPSSEFRTKLRTMGGTPEEVLGNEDLMNYFEPILRADFQAVETYTYTQGPAHYVPLTVLYGDEEDITEESALLWGKETINRITLRRMQGNHFFIFQNPFAIAEELSKPLTKYSENELHILL